MRERDEQLLNTGHIDLGIILRAAHQHLIDIKSPVSFKISEVFRSEDNQDKKWQVGRKLIDGVWTIVGKVITYIDGKIKKGTHQKKLAADIIATYEGKVTFDIEYYYYIASLVELEAYRRGIKMKWGGWFKRKNGKRFIDGMHFELVK